MRNNEPSGVNFVSLLLLIAVVGAGYWGWKYFPHYWDGWQVDHVLQDGAAKTYKIQRLGEPARSQARQQLVDEMRTRIVKLGIDDPEMSVDLEVEGEEVTVTCDYSVEIKHPIGDKVSQLKIHRVKTGDLKRVNWGEDEQ